MKKLFCVFLVALLISTTLLGCGKEAVAPETTAPTQTVPTIPQSVYDDIESAIRPVFAGFEECTIDFDGNQITARAWATDFSEAAELMLILWDSDFEAQWSEFRDIFVKASTSIQTYAENAGIENPSAKIIVQKDSTGNRTFLEVCNGQIIYDAAAQDSVAVETEAVETTTHPETNPTVTELSMTSEQRNAIRKAEDYLDFSAFSHDGLIHQLKYEGFSTEDATFAADNCGADWNEQALRDAIDYLDYSAFSYTGLIRQLEYEKYTTEQATYGADNCGADWNEQAVKKAKEYLDFSAFSRNKLIDQLTYEGFTRDQATYGVDQNGL